MNGELRDEWVALLSNSGYGSYAQDNYPDQSYCALGILANLAGENKAPDVIPPWKRRKIWRHEKFGRFNPFNYTFNDDIEW